MTASLSLMDLGTVPWEEFVLRWRFIEPERAVLPAAHVEQIRPLDVDGAARLWTATRELHHSEPFTQRLFSHVEETSLVGAHEDAERASAIRKWLYERGLPFQHDVLLSWGRHAAVRTTWKIVVRYFDAFWYPSSDDLTVVDASLTWVVLFHHEEVLSWGTSKGRAA
jgi:hypothetical protein